MSMFLSSMGRVLEPLRQQAHLPQRGGEIPVIGVAGDLAFGQVNDRRAAHRDLLARLPEGVGGVPEPLVALCPGPSAWPEPAREQEEHLRARQRHPEADAQTGAAHIALQIVLQDVEKFQLRHNGPG